MVNQGIVLKHFNIQEGINAERSQKLHETIGRSEFNNICG